MSREYTVTVITGSTTCATIRMDQQANSWTSTRASTLYRRLRQIVAVVAFPLPLQLRLPAAGPARSEGQAA